MASFPINIPPNFDILVKKGDFVHVGQVLARRSSSLTDDDDIDNTTKECIVNIAQEFNIPSAAVRKYLKKGPGDMIHKGDLIASKSSIFSLKRENLISAVEGTILRFERDTGNLVIRMRLLNRNVSPHSNPEIIVSPLDGIVSVWHNDAIVIKGEGDTFQGISGSVGKIQGQLSTLHFKSGVEVKSSDLGITDREKIILVGGIGREALAKAGALEVSGIITSRIDDSDLEYVNRSNIKLPLVLVSEEVAKDLVKCEGESVLVDADTRTILVKK